MDEALHLAFTDFDGYLNTLDADSRTQLQSIFSNNINEEESKVRYANQLYYRSKTGEDGVEVAKNWLDYRENLSRNLGLPALANQSQIHGAISGKLNDQKSEEEFAGEQDEDLQCT